jgi:1-acyl-sn-glycerol-3-phosphate acyltransferase
MIPARHTSFHVRFFDFYSRWMIRSHFSRVRIISEIKASSNPVLMIGNHFSWWDGFIACYINREVFRKKLHIMMLEDQLKPRMFLNKAGAYSIKRGSRDALASLNYTSELLEKADSLVVMYPQGEFQSVYQYPVAFGKGIELVSKRTGREIQLVFYAALIDYFSERKPSLTIYLKEVPQSLAGTATGLESAYNDFLKNCYSRQKPQ